MKFGKTKMTRNSWQKIMIRVWTHYMVLWQFEKNIYMTFLLLLHLLKTNQLHASRLHHIRAYWSPVQTQDRQRATTLNIDIGYMALTIHIPFLLYLHTCWDFYVQNQWSTCTLKWGTGDTTTTIIIIILMTLNYFCILAILYYVQYTHMVEHIFLQWLLRNIVFIIPNQISGYTHYTRIKKECYFQLWNI